MALFDACVDLNPHQIEAAMFALRSPLSKGVVLADEVGLGKTIESGLVLCQHWAERKRKLLVICPAKALVFTESRRTQDYLKNFLESNGFVADQRRFCIRLKRLNKPSMVTGPPPNAPPTTSPHSRELATLTGGCTSCHGFSLRPS